MYVDLEYVYLNLRAGKASFVFLIIFTINIICYAVKTIVIIFSNMFKRAPAWQKKNNKKYDDIFKLHSRYV